MSDLNRFWKHLEQAQAERHTQGQRGSYRIDPATNKIVFVHDTRKGIEVRKDRKGTKTNGR